MMQNSQPTHEAIDADIDSHFVDMSEEPLRMPRPVPVSVPQSFHRCIFFTGWLMTLISTCILLAMSCTMSSISNEVVDVFHDSQTTLADLQIIIPEIKESLHILDEFCGIPEFSKYCHPGKL
jgi:hypothetical protein